MKQVVKKPKRIKRVFSNSSQVLHLWANQSQDSARQGGRITRTYFDGKSCYSYGRHYELGRLVKIKGVTVALINATGYSHTTRNHIRDAWSAVSHLPRIRVNNDFNYKQGLLTEQADIINSIFNELCGRSAWSQSCKYFKQSTAQRITAFNSTCKAVGMEHLSLPSPLPEDLSALIQAHLHLCYSNTQAKHSAMVQRRDEERKELLIKGAAEIEKWCLGLSSVTNAVRAVHPAKIRTVLRDGVETVETSQGASVPLLDALNLLSLIDAGKAKQGDTVGSFKFDKVKGSVVTIGCHEIDLDAARTVLRKQSEAA